MSRTGTNLLKTGVDLLGQRLMLDVREIRQRCMVDPAFRALCEDYSLACKSRTQLEQMGVEDAAPVLAEYTTVIQELEAEATAALRTKWDEGR